MHSSPMPPVVVKANGVNVLFRRFYDIIALISHCSARMRSFVVSNTRWIDCLLVRPDVLVILTECF